MRQLIIAGLSLAAACFLSPADARVQRIEIVSRQAFAAGTEFGHAGAYEKLRGRAFFALDPDTAANGPIADLKLAPRNDRGLVEFSAEFLVLRPADVTRRNGTLLYEVNNRGNIAIFRQLHEAPSNNDPSTAADVGNGFLLRQGFTLVWSAWASDVASTPGDNRLVLRPPIATKDALQERRIEGLRRHRVIHYAALRSPASPAAAGLFISRPSTLPTGFIAPCLPTKAPRPPSGGFWLHEIKHDGFRVIARKQD